MFHKVVTNTELESIFEEVIANVFPNLMETKSSDPRRSANLRKKKNKQLHIILNLLKTSEKENLKDIQRKKDIILKRTKKNQYNPEHNVCKVLKEKLSKFKSTPITCSQVTMELN